MKHNFLYILAIIFVLSFAGCSQNPEEVILTVTGPIPVSEMGISLTHEHVLVDFIGADSTGYHRWDRQEAAERIMPFLREIQDSGVGTFIECTPAYVGRDPELLRIISQQTGLHLVTNTGYYGAQSNKYLPESFYSLTARELSGLWIDEFENGIGESGIRPGFIKIAVDRNDTLSADHVKIVTAAAYANSATGLVIASHTGPDGPAFAQIKILRSYGVNPSSFIWVHAQRGTLEGNIRAGKMGAWISLDNVNTGRDPVERFGIDWYADRIVSLKEAGLLHRVLISHDAGWYSPGSENGGDYRGYTGVFSELIPALMERGCTQKDIDQLLVINPGEAFSISLES